MTTLQLDSGAASLVLAVVSGKLCLLHLGPRLTTETASLSALNAPVLPHGELHREPLTLAYPCQDGRPGLMPALEVRRHGRRLLTELQVRQAATDSQGLSVDLEDPLAAVAVKYQVESSGNEAFTFKLSVTNTGADPLDVDWLASGHIPLPSRLQRIFSHGGTWANEFQRREAQVADHLQSWISDRGRSSHGSSASLVLGTQHLSEQHGSALQMALLWPGNHRLSVGPLSEGGYGAQGGVLLEPGELVLAPGEQYESPGLVVTLSDRGRNGLRTAMSRYWSSRAPGNEQPPCLVHFNSWEGCYFDHDEAKMLKLIGEAKKLGAERFVLDDGWMEHRSAPGVGLGDWRPCPHRYPNGLKPIADAARDAGMEFGLWVEPESVTPDSQLASDHAEWVIQADEREPVAGREQYLLDMSRADMQTHILRWLDRLVDETDLSYLKWDMNRDYAQVGRESSTSSLVMTEGFRTLVKQFRERHPAVTLELCGAGGARTDAGTMLYADRLWPTDSLDPLQRWQVARNSSVLLPPPRLGWHIGAAPAETSGAMLPLNTRCALALLGHMGIELNPAALHDTERATVEHWIRVYKNERDWLTQAEWQFLDTNPGDAEALLLSAADETQAFLFLVQASYPRQGFTSLLRLPGLPRERRYRVTSMNPDDHAFAQQLPAWLGDDSAPIPGELLRLSGLRAPPLRYGHCAVIRLDETEDD